MTPVTRHYSNFVHALPFECIPSIVWQKAELSLLDSCGVTSAGSRMKAAGIMSRFARQHYAHAPEASAEFRARLLFDGSSVSPGGAALAAGQAADSMDAHDGYHEIKGSHVSSTLLGGLLAIGEIANNTAGLEFTGDDLLSAWIIGQEMAIRFGCALQSSMPDVYIPSGLIGAIGIAAMGGRLLRLNPEITRHALGIAELHGPRVQTTNGWRVTVFPSMLKDTVCWGSMAGVNAVLMAREEFTGAPCGVLEEESFQSYFNDLGNRWRSPELYMKPVPCCRYAIPAVRAVLQLLEHEAHAQGLSANEVAEVTVTTFREAWLLGRDIPVPDDAETAQYHVAWPVAAAMVTGRLPGPQELSDEAIADDTRIQNMCRKVKVVVNDDYTQAFPGRTLADVRIRLVHGRTMELAAAAVVNNEEIQPGEAGHSIPLNEFDPDLGVCNQQALIDKFHRYASWGVGPERAAQMKQVVFALRGGDHDAATDFLDAMLTPPSH
ncbi:MAG: MmgE/PrpD family protein [Gammaproteobacteria bacterium]|nr:MmgE/PrpD family protein [Gammaproteobacteria bacterium]